MKDLWIKAEEIVREQIAEGGPCEDDAHFNRMVAEKHEELCANAADEADFARECALDRLVPSYCRGEA